MLEVRMSRTEMPRLDRLAGERRHSRSGLIRSLISAASAESAAVHSGELADLLELFGDERPDARG
jgi:hypothetical protein